MDKFRLAGICPTLNTRRKKAPHVIGSAQQHRRPEHVTRVVSHDTIVSGQKCFYFLKNRKEKEGIEKNIKARCRAA